MRFVTTLSASLLLLAMIFCTSCVAPLAVGPVGTASIAAAQVGSAAFTAGQLRVTRHATLEQTWRAVHAALDELELVVHVERTSETRWYVMARDELGGREFKIQLDRRSPVMTRIGIRVGIIGEVSTSRLLMEQIDAHLLAQRGP